MSQYEVEIRRYDPERDKRPHWETYEVEADPKDRVLDALHEIRWHQDPTLTFRRSCAHGVCGSDAMLINGVNRLACVVLMDQVGPRLRIEPIRGLPVLRDLLVDMEPFFDQYKAMKPWLQTSAAPWLQTSAAPWLQADAARPAPGSPPSERLQSPEERARFDDTTKCILCAACTTSCPVFWGGGSYVGPAAIVNAHRFLFDSRDEATAERIEILDNRSGVWGCRTAFNCTEACPRGIKVTEAIAEVKRLRFED